MKTTNNKTPRTMYSFLYFCLIIGALFCACESPIEQSKSENVGGRAIIRIEELVNRSLVPTANPNFSKYELVFRASGKTMVSKTLTNVIDRTAVTGNGYEVELGEGTWNLTVTASVSATGGYLEAAYGTCSLTVSATNAATAAITLNPFPMDGVAKGIFSWNFDVSGVIGTPAVSGTIEQDGIPITNFSTATGSMELASGYYDLVITVSNDGKSTGVYRAVHIYPGLTTRAEGEDFTFSLTSGTEVPGESGNNATPRYETVPYTDYNLVYSAYDTTSYYYVFLLGKVKHTPLAYRQSFFYDGIYPIHISYSSASISTESIGQSVQTAFEHSVTSGTSTISSHETEIKPEINILGFGGSIYGYTWGESNEWRMDETETRSTANTYETVRTKSLEERDEVTTDIEGNKPVGWYRYAFFTTTDVYYVLITDKQKSKIRKGYIAMCARPVGGWGIDYDNDGGSFGKTVSGDLLKIPNLSLSQLPIPTEEIEDGSFLLEKSATPDADKKTGNYTSQVIVTLASATEGAAIYYTTNGNTPTVNSTRYTGPITITQTATLKAVAVMSDMENSDIMAETYTILTAIGTNPGIDVWGGKLTYTYKVLNSGIITATLVGGGAGGTGAAASDGSGGADAGRSSDGGPTVLKLNGNEIKRANGGTGKDGPSFTHGATNGLPGDPATPISYEFSVNTDDIITIEVGYGGGGSGGAANSNSGEWARSPNSQGYNYSIGAKRGSGGDVTNGGVGASPFGGTGYSQRGENAPTAGDNQWGGQGGQSKGAGGTGGRGYEGSHAYASGGGGGAAGGFTLQSETVAVVEVEQ
jgi:hypothetical protein